MSTSEYKCKKLNYEIEIKKLKYASEFQFKNTQNTSLRFELFLTCKFFFFPLKLSVIMMQITDGPQLFLTCAKAYKCNVPWLKTSLRLYEVIHYSKFLLYCRVVMESSINHWGFPFRSWVLHTFLLVQFRHILIT